MSAPSPLAPFADLFGGRTAGEPQDSKAFAWRVLTLLNLFRLLVPIVLISLFFGIKPKTVGVLQPALFVAAVTAYFLFAVLTIGSLKKRWPAVELQTWLQVCLDILAIAVLTYSSGGLSSGLATLLFLPIGVASLIVTQRVALMFAAVAALSLLFQQSLGLFTEASDPGDIAAAGVIGVALFGVALLSGWVTGRLQESEELVRQRDVDIANLAELNNFIVQHLRESIVVVDTADRIRLINESAAQLLKGSDIARDTLLGEISPRLLYLLDTWRRNQYDWQANSSSMVSADGGTLIQPHFVALEAKPGPTLIFLEDTSLVASRVQQSKLAALGRLSASIAHEIRNPVGAMSHAAQLLGESATLPPQEQRLTEIIRTNGERVSSIVDNVLQLSRRDTTRQERISLQEWLSAFMEEFHETFQIDAATLAVEGEFPEMEIRVDPSHLHQLMWNLCENALKYGQHSNGRVPIEVRYGRIAASSRPYLEVADRGPGIDAKDAERIFEPFFTSGGGTGLGLFIARELAQCNRAVLLYEPRQGGGTIFRVVFADPQRWET